MVKMPLKPLKKPESCLRRNFHRRLAAVLICLLPTFAATSATARSCSEEFSLRKETRLCGLDASSLGGLFAHPGDNYLTIPRYALKERGKFIAPSLTSAYYPLSGLESYSADMRNLNIRIENYMMSLIFPLSDLKEQYDILKLLIEERKE